jgi:hypothetical protein
VPLKMDSWYKVIQPRAEVREGRSFNPDELAIVLDQVVAGTLPQDYTNPANFSACTCFQGAGRAHGNGRAAPCGETV